jgi:hypothetical protein
MNFIELGVHEKTFTISKSTLTCSFCTVSSVSFTVKFAHHRGWIAVHFPCQGHIKVHIQGGLAAECLDPVSIRELIAGILNQLSIPADETYEALFFTPTRVIRMAQPVDREGMTDRLESRTKWCLPKD